jgi:hypothetical protein
VYTRVTQAFFQAVWPARKWEYHGVQRVIAVYLFVTTMLLVWMNVPFDILTQIAGFLLSNLAIAMIMVAALYLNYRLPTVYRTRLPLVIGGVLSAVILSVFAVISGWGLAIKLFGA